MKITYKVLPIILSVGLFACNDSAELAEDNSAESNTQEVSQTSNPTEAEATNQATGEVFESQLPDDAPVINVSTEANYAPYEFKDEYGNVTGFDIELIRVIGEDQGFKVNIHNDDWDSVFTNLDNNSRDVVVAGITYSQERDEKYLLSDPYLPLPSAFVYVDKNLSIDSFEDLNGLKVGVLDDSEPYRFFSANSYDIASLETYNTVYLAIEAMMQGKIDAVAGDSGVIRYIIDPIDTEPKYFEYDSLEDAGAWKVMIVSPEHPEILEQINQGLADIQESGQYAELTTKWFGTDLTSLAQKQQALQKPTVTISE